MKMLSVGSITVGTGGVLGGGIALVLLVGAILGFTFWKNSRGGKILTDTFLEPLGSAMEARVDINTNTGNLSLDRLTGSEDVLVDGTLQYMENQGLPTRSVDRSNGQVSFTLEASGQGQPWFRFPWQTCNGATEWQIHLNPSVPSDISLYTGGGNVRLNLADMAVTHVLARTGGGNVDVFLPDNAANLRMTAKTGGGNVTIAVGSGITGKIVIDAHSGGGNLSIRLPAGIAARIQATSGMGKVVVDPSFVRLDKKIYQTSNYDSAADKVEITLDSGAGNVAVSTW
jgi:hypothetical protein